MLGWGESGARLASMVLLSVNGGLEKLGNHWEIITALVFGSLGSSYRSHFLIFSYVAIKSP